VIQIICSSTLYFEAVRLASSMHVPKVLVDHYTPGTFLYLFEEDKPPSGLNVEAIKLREDQA